MSFAWMLACARHSVFTEEQRADSWVASEAGGEVFASCASCHMADGSGWRDGQVPRLAGQRREVIERKLHALRDGRRDLPAMMPYARANTAEQSAAIASFLEDLPEPRVGYGPGSDLAKGEDLYRTRCVVCHESSGVPKLAGQQFAYLDRRLREYRESGGPMQAIASALRVDERESVADYLSRQSMGAAP